MNFLQKFFKDIFYVTPAKLDKQFEAYPELPIDVEYEEIMFKEEKTTKPTKVKKKMATKKPDPVANNTKKSGPAKKATSGKAGPGGGKPLTTGVDPTKVDKKAGTSKVGTATKKNASNQGPTTSANKTGTVKKK